MKVIWEEEDIQPGLRLSPSNGSDEKFIMGFICSKGNIYSMISLNDGMVIPLGSKKEFAAWLNASGSYLPTAISPLIKLRRIV